MPEPQGRRAACSGRAIEPGARAAGHSPCAPALLWGDTVVGWGYAAAREGALEIETGFVGKPERGAVFGRSLAEETALLSAFLGL